MERIWYMCVMGTVVFVWVMKALLFPTISSAGANGMPGRETAEMGKETTALLEQLQNPEFHPQVAGTVTHPPFSIKGDVVILGKDNIQVFEYDNSRDAERELAKVREYYEKIASKNMWNSIIHVYRRDALLVFYMGTREPVTAQLSQVMGIAMIGGSAFAEQALAK